VEFIAGKVKVPIMIYVEGSTSNGEYLMSFKKGAFASLLPVQPVTTVSLTQMISVNPFATVFLAMCTNPFKTITQKFSPVFTPNEYFWKNHQKAGEQKIDTYIRTIHKIMMESGGFKDGSKWKAEDRFEYIREYRGLKEIKSEQDLE
jgi:lysophosphatidylcholine acyltransferase/lyso-PAF acetyltransferase